MAERGRRSAPRVPHHPLPAALASDPGKPPRRATRLFGFPGPASAAKSTRLWLDADLTSYVEVPDEAIVHSQTLENDQGTILWVEPSATLTHSTTQSQEVQAEFLGGAIAEGNLAGAARNLVPAALFEMGGMVTWTDNPPCPKPGSFSPRECHTRECQSVEWICPPVETRDIPCPSWWPWPCERRV